MAEGAACWCSRSRRPAPAVRRSTPRCSAGPPRRAPHAPARPRGGRRVSMMRPAIAAPGLGPRHSTTSRPRTGMPPATGRGPRSRRSSATAASGWRSRPQVDARAHLGRGARSRPWPACAHPRGDPADVNYEQPRPRLRPRLCAQQAPEARIRVRALGTQRSGYSSHNRLRPRRPRRRLTRPYLLPGPTVRIESRCAPSDHRTWRFLGNVLMDRIGPGSVQGNIRSTEGPRLRRAVRASELIVRFEKGVSSRRGATRSTARRCWRRWAPGPRAGPARGRRVGERLRGEAHGEDGSPSPSRTNRALPAGAAQRHALRGALGLNQTRRRHRRAGGLATTTGSKLIVAG